MTAEELAENKWFLYEMHREITLSAERLLTCECIYWYH